MKTSQDGFTFVEIMIAFSILAAATYAVIVGLDSINSQKIKSENSSSLEAILSSQLDQIRASIASEKIDFKSQDFLNLNDFDQVKDSLNLRWNKNGIYRADDCSGCKGRLGYVIYPHRVGTLLFRGLFKVTIRVTHDDLFPNRFKQYSYIVRGE